MRQCQLSTVAISLLLMSCASGPTEQQSPRRLILDGTPFTVPYNELASWVCRDFEHGGDILVELGSFFSPEVGMVGFVLYDGSSSGETAHYQREGLHHRWDWGPSGNDYAFVIKSDGSGLYYDFSRASTGKPSEIYKCTRR